MSRCTFLAPTITRGNTRLSFLAIVLSLIAAGAAAQSDAARARERPPSSRDTASEIIELTNAERGQARLPQLKANARLNRAAQLHAEQMATAEQLGHVLRGAAHPRPEDRLAAVKYEWMAWAENVAWGQTTASRVVSDWMRSKGHRRNILNDNFTEMGAARALDPKGRPYYVQLFGRPLERGAR